MNYMLLLYSEPSNDGPAPGTAEFDAMMATWMAYGDALVEAGAMVAGDALLGVETATTVDVSGGETITTDGPFAETKEVLGGYYIIDVADLDEAIVWAERNPIQNSGRVEIRPLMVLPADAAGATTSSA